ncbi:DUF624 domain-containing protein [Luteimicrobium sp. DT211]|uniref:DUF624 domain-containing protein n=1 Tax=Luteimicrobium sp. DT211 TaxID=3393412 RepID=UPI003CF06926
MSDVTHPDPPGPHVPGDLGHGALGRLTAVVYWFAVVTVLLAVAASPTIVLLLLLDRSAGNVLLVAVAAIPVGPALSAALYTMRDRERTGEADGELAPARSFVRGYRLGVADVLRVWVPALVVLGVIGTVLVNAGAAGVSGPYAVVLGVLAVAILTWALHAVAIATFFNFRTRDVARLATFYLGRFPVVSLGVVSLVVVAGAAVWVGTEVLLALVGGVWAWFWYRGDQRLLDDVRDRFTTAD